MRTLLAFAKDESGATSIEYAIIASSIAVAIIAVVQSLGGKVNATYERVDLALSK